MAWIRAVARPTPAGGPRVRRRGAGLPEYGLWDVLVPAGSVLAGAAILLTPGLLTRMRSSRLLAVTATAGAPSASQPR